jgi:hypothetical protein
MQVLALSIVSRSISPLVPSVLNTIGYSKKVMRNTARLTFLMPAAFFIGSRWGMTGVAMAWLLVHPIGQVFQFRLLSQAIGLRFRAYLKAIGPALVSSAVMGMSVLAADRLLDEAAAWPRLIAEIAIGAMVYPLCLLGLFGTRIRAVISGVRTSMQPKADASRLELQPDSIPGPT